MAIHVVPVIYDHATKKVLRWFLLDTLNQLDDHAFNPSSVSERRLLIPMQTYRCFGNINGLPALTDLQNYVNGAAP